MQLTQFKNQMDQDLQFYQVSILQWLFSLLLTFLASKPVRSSLARL
jgi:hypothetical protein